MDGVINIYKPKNMTSYDVIRNIKKIVNQKKIGHTGTLDPLACGVLPICLGKSTKIVDFIMKDYKIYKVLMKLGVETDTYDREGSIINISHSLPNKTDIHNIINSFVGEADQVPPMYSALKINGKRLYELARKGIEVERLPRKVTFYEIVVDNITMPFVELKVKCSKGTYIRSLCYDIGKKLSCGATMWELERIASGIFTVEKSVSLNVLNNKNIQEYLISTEKCLQNYSKIDLPNKFYKLLTNGVRINDPLIIKNTEFNIIYRVYVENKFIGLGQNNEGTFKIIKLLT